MYHVPHIMCKLLADFLMFSCSLVSWLSFQFQVLFCATYYTINYMYLVHFQYIENTYLVENRRIANLATIIYFQLSVIITFEKSYFESRLLIGKSLIKKSV